MPAPRYKSISIDLETYEKLARQAEESYRSIPAHIRYLVDVVERECIQTNEVIERIAALPER